MSNIPARLGPLARFRVLDLTRVRSGPTCVRQLADWGADVIKIEAPAQLERGGGWAANRHGSDFQNLHRNKRCITLNLKQPDGVEIFRRLSDRADVVVENFRPDVKFRLGIDYETLKQTNPRLVYASISGFGQTGPYAKRPGFDQITQGMGGLMAITGAPGQGPMRAGIAVSDSSAGIYCALGILTALLEREESGEGQWVQVSLLQAMIAMLDFQAARWLVEREVPAQTGNDHPTQIPTGVFQTADGYLNIGAAEQSIWERLCQALGADELITRPRYANTKLRSQNRVACNEDLNLYTRRKSSREWLDIFEKAGVASGPIYTVDEMFADPQVQHVGASVAVNHDALGEINLVAQPYSLSRTPSEIRHAVPERGAHTEEVLHEFGYVDAEIEALRQRTVI